MKSNWPLVKLEEVAELTVGFVGTMAKHYTQDGVTFLRSTNIEPFNIKFDDIKFISSEFNERISKSQLRGGDVVIVRTGKPGACTVIPEIEGSWNCSDLVIVRPHQEKLDPLYLAAYINLASGTINNQLVGAVQQHFNVASAKKLEIPIPPIEVQRKISSLIGNLNDKIAINNKINDNLQQQAVAIFRQWFSVNPESEKWPVVTLDRLTLLISRGIAPKYDDDSTQIVLNQKCIRDHYIDTLQARRHKPKVINEKWLQYGDLLINSTGEGTLGRAAQVWFVPENMTVDSHVTIIRPQNQLLLFYIGLWGISHEREIEALHTGSTGQTELPRDRVKAMELRLPDNDTLTRFNDVIAPMVSAIVVNQQENARLASVRDALLPKLMSGEIDVSEIDI